MSSGTKIDDDTTAKEFFRQVVGMMIADEISAVGVTIATKEGGNIPFTIVLGDIPDEGE